MSLITWSDRYKTGNYEVDSQHQELFRIVNDLHEAIKEQRGKAMLFQTLDDLADYVVYHFKTEENLMEIRKYPGLAEHKAIHEQLTKEALDIIQGYKSGKHLLAVTLTQFLGNWIKNHIKDEDMKMINFIKGDDKLVGQF